MRRTYLNLTAKEIEKIIMMRKRKTTLKKIGFEFGVSGVAIRNWLKWIDKDYKQNLKQWRPVQIARKDRKSVFKFEGIRI